MLVVNDCTQIAQLCVDQFVGSLLLVIETHTNERKFSPAFFPNYHEVQQARQASSFHCFDVATSVYHS